MTAQAAPSKNGGPDYTDYFQLRCRQAVHSRVAKFRIAAVGNCISHFNRNCNCCTSRAMLQESEEGSRMRVRTIDRALLFCALQDVFADFSVVYYVGLVYPRPHFGLLSRGEAVPDEPAQYAGHWGGEPERTCLYTCCVSVLVIEEQ